jgi:hypothetical protein
MENRISIQIPPEVQEKVKAAVKVIDEALKPYLKSLTADERQTLPKMGDTSIPFVRKGLEYTQTNPEFAPAYISPEELLKDVVAVEVLSQVFRPMSHVTRALEDTIMLAGSEAYVAALGYYNSVKQAKKLGIPAAAAIYEDLHKRFPRRKGKDSEPAE